MKNLALALGIVLLNTLLTAPAAAQGPCETLKLANPYEGEFTHYGFGWSVLLRGNTAMVGLPSGTSISGQVLVYERQLWGWEMVQILEASDPDPWNEFGHALALDGDTLAVGAYRVGALNYKGAVYIFERQPDGPWVETQKITTTDSKAWGLGWSVALQGDDLIVGAVGAVALGDGGGRVLFYRREATGWVLKYTYPSPDPQAGDAYGTALAVEGDQLLIGQTDDNHGATPPVTGFVYVYQRLPVAWIYKGKLAPADLTDYDRFGQSLAISDGTLLVGAPSQVAGVAYVYELNDGSWSQAGKLVPGDGQISDYFGEALDLEGDRAVIGARGDDDLGSIAGSAYVFDRQDGTWAETSKFYGSDLVKSDSFARNGIDLDGDDILVGAPATATGSTNRGTAYFFTFAAGPHLTTLTPEISLSQGSEQVLELGACSDHAGDLYLFAGTATDTTPGFAFAGLDVPLNPDVYFLYTLQHVGAGPVFGAIGTLDAYGRADAAFALPPGISPALAGLTLHHAYAVIDVPTLQVEAVSPAVPVSLVP